MERTSRGGLLSAGLGASLGVLGVLWSPLLLPWPVLALGLLIVLAIRSWPRWPLLWCLLGASWTLWHASNLLDARWPAERHGEDVTVQGRIAELPLQRADHWRFRFEALPGEAVQGAIRTSWYFSDVALAGGQCWVLQLRMRTPRGAVSPGAFDYERWLFAEGYVASAYVREGRPCAEAAPPPWWRSMRQHLDAALGRWLEDHPALDLARALTVANRNGLDEDDWRVLRVTGTSHLVAISGLHVGLVAGLFLFLGRWSWQRSAWLCRQLPAPRAGLLAGTAAALAYAALAGFSVPTQRALLMWAVVALALWSGHRTRAWHVLMLAWLAVLAFDPLAVLGAGTWLSFLAVATIVLVSSERAGGAAVWWRIPRLQAALLVGLTPATLLFFDGASLLAPVVNAVVIPAFAVLLPLLLASVALAWAGGSTLPLTAAAHLLEWLRQGLILAAESAPMLWLEAVPGPLILLCAAWGAFLLLSPQLQPLRLLGLICWLPLLWPRPGLAPGVAEVAVLDVGQGLSVVVRTREHTLVYDAGPAWPGGFDAGEAIVVPYLRQAGVRAVDRLIISHPHRDHAGGAPAVGQGLPVVEHWEEGGTVCRHPQRWDWNGVAFEVLHPRQPARWQGNNRSCVLRVSAGGQRLLITGDIEATAEHALRAAAPEGLRSQIVVVPHHGSRTSSTPAFVAATQADWALFSAGWRNRHGHPHPEVQRRWEGAGARTLSTGDAGSLEVRLGAGSKPALRAAREQQRIWRAAFRLPAAVD